MPTRQDRPQQSRRSRRAQGARPTQPANDGVRQRHEARVDRTRPGWWGGAQDQAWARASDTLGQDLTPSLIMTEDQERASVRYGVGAASYFAELATWDRRLEALLREEWLELDNGVRWEDACPLVMRDWEWGREDLAPHRN